MAFTVRPIVVTDVGTADAALILPQLVARGAFESVLKPELWVHPILAFRTSGQLSLRAALVLARHIVISSGVTSLTRTWPPIAAVDCLGQVDTSTLTVECLGQLLRQAHLLSFGVLGGNLKTPKHLTDAVAARKGIAVSACGPQAAVWGTFLERVGEALAPVLGTTMPV